MRKIMLYTAALILGLTSCSKEEDEQMIVDIPDIETTVGKWEIRKMKINPPSFSDKYASAGKTQQVNVVFNDTIKTTLEIDRNFWYDEGEDDLYHYTATYEGTVSIEGYEDKLVQMYSGLLVNTSNNEIGTEVCTNVNNLGQCDATEWHHDGQVYLIEDGEWLFDEVFPLEAYTFDGQTIGIDGTSSNGINIGLTINISGN